jgi:hypothetical protein
MGELFDKGANLVTDAPVVREGLFFTRGMGRKAGRVIEALVNNCGAARKDRAALVGIAADSDDIIKRDVRDIA